MELEEGYIAVRGGFVVGQKNGYRVGSHFIRHRNNLCLSNDYCCCLFSVFFCVCFFRIWFYDSVQFYNKLKRRIWWDRTCSTWAVGKFRWDV